MPTLRTICASLLLAGACTATFAQSCAPGQWLAEYFPNTALSGAPVLSRCEDGPVNHYWGGAEGSPDPARLPVDGFSARWTGTLPFEAGPAKFITFTDDGVRVFVDGQNVIDNWTLHGVTMDVATLPMTAGQHTVRMEYFEGGGDGLAQFVIEQDRVSTPTDPTDPGDPGPNPNPNPEPPPSNPLPVVGGLGATATPQGVRLGWNPVTSSGKWVNGYYTGWFWEYFPPEAVDMSTMTHFIFGRYAPGQGSLPGGQAGELMEGAGTAHTQAEDRLIAKAHAAGTKAIMMLGGEFDGPGFMAATADAGIRATFIKNILDKAEQKGYDGVDVDWEENLDTAQGRAQALALLRELRAAAQQRPTYQPPNAPFEISWPGFWVNVNFPGEITSWHVQVAEAVDRFNLMTYSMAGDWGGGWQSWHHSPLFGESGSHPTSVASTVQAYLNAGVPRAKLGIGVGLYGMFYNNPITGPRQSGMHGSNSGDGVNSYQRLVNDNAFGQPGATYHWDDVAKQSYISYSQPWWRASDAPVTYLSYEDERSIAEKGRWVREQGLGGTLVWTINYGYLPSDGSNPQMQAVKQSFMNASASGYRVYRDGAAIATVANAVQYVDTAAPGGSHRYQVAMIDATGKEGPLSAAVSVQAP